ncbi:hypothetical protein G5576_104881, partial [Homo sapiens]
QKEDDVACSRRLSWGSSRRRNNSSSSFSPHFLGPGVGGAASKGCLIRNTRGFLSSGGSPLRPANASLEEMASLEEEACSLKLKLRVRMIQLRNPTRSRKGRGIDFETRAPQ